MLFLPLAAAAMAAEIRVPDDEADLDAAVLAAADGDVIRITAVPYTDPGTGVVRVTNKSLTIVSDGTTAQTIVPSIAALVGAEVTLTGATVVNQPGAVRSGTWFNGSGTTASYTTDVTLIARNGGRLIGHDLVVDGQGAGGVRLDLNAEMELTDIEITNVGHDAAISVNDGSQITVVGCDIHDNNTEGGAIGATGLNQGRLGALRVEDCTIHDNQHVFWNITMTEADSVVLRNVSWTGNVSDHPDEGAELFWTRDVGSTTLENLIAADNTLGNGVVLGSDATIDGLEVTRSVGGFGQGLVVGSGAAVGASGVTVQQNTGWGAVAVFDASSLTLTNGTFIDNGVVDFGNAFLEVDDASIFTGSGIDVQGGAGWNLVYVAESTVSLSQVDFADVDATASSNLWTMWLQDADTTFDQVSFTDVEHVDGGIAVNGGVLALRNSSWTGGGGGVGGGVRRELVPGGGRLGRDGVVRDVDAG